MGIADDLKKAFFEGYEAGKKDAEFYMLHCGDETPVSNGDRIRSMSDEELAMWLIRILDKADSKCSCLPCSDFCNGKSCKDGMIDWLKQEVAE